MQYLGMDIPVKNLPPLDPGFVPLGLFQRAYLAEATEPVTLALEHSGDAVAVVHTRLRGDDVLDHYYIDRLVKNLLWQKGGYRLYTDHAAACAYLKAAYRPGGSRSFDAAFMSQVYGQPFEVLLSDTVPQERQQSRAVGGHWDGCRIGFDAGGSDRKVSAVMDGKTVFSEEVVWSPKTASDPAYHYAGIVSALRRAAAHLPRVDAVGVSTAGVIVEDRVKVSSLFRAVPETRRGEVQDIFVRAVTDTFGAVPCSVINDGDVTALAGAMTLGESSVLGIAMGTSEAAGFVDGAGHITGWLNELAFAPVDASPDAETDEWSGDRGCGVKYFSQEAVIRLAGRAGIILDAASSPAEQLKAVQTLMAQGDARAAMVYDSLGVYLGHTLALYEEMYRCRHVLLLGRVMSGAGGDRILAEARRVLAEEYPEIALTVSLPDEAFRRLGQSTAAAALPKRG